METAAHAGSNAATLLGSPIGGILLAALFHATMRPRLSRRLLWRLSDNTMEDVDENAVYERLFVNVGRYTVLSGPGRHDWYCPGVAMGSWRCRGQQRTSQAAYQRAKARSNAWCILRQPIECSRPQSSGLGRVIWSDSRASSWLAPSAKLAAALAVCLWLRPHWSANITGRSQGGVVGGVAWGQAARTCRWGYGPNLWLRFRGHAGPAWRDSRRDRKKSCRLIGTWLLWIYDFRTITPDYESGGHEFKSLQARHFPFATKIVWRSRPIAEWATRLLFCAVVPIASHISTRLYPSDSPGRGRMLLIALVWGRMFPGLPSGQTRHLVPVQGTEKDLPMSALHPVSLFIYKNSRLMLRTSFKGSTHDVSPQPSRQEPDRSGRIRQCSIAALDRLCAAGRGAGVSSVLGCGAP